MRQWLRAERRAPPRPPHFDSKRRGEFKNDYCQRKGTPSPRAVYAGGVSGGAAAFAPQRGRRAQWASGGPVRILPPATASRRPAGNRQDRGGGARERRGGERAPFDRLEGRAAPQLR